MCGAKKGVRNMKNGVVPNYHLQKKKIIIIIIIMIG
jgi:hypothetical protein